MESRRHDCAGDPTHCSRTETCSPNYGTLSTGKAHRKMDQKKSQRAFLGPARKFAIIRNAIHSQ